MIRIFSITLMMSLSWGCAMPTTPTIDEPALPALGPADVGNEDDLRALDFLNDPTTDLRTLDDEVGVNRRGARNLIAHRNGPDGVYPSYDDNPFQTLAEVESVRYVGPVSVQLIVDFARDRMIEPGVMVEGILFSEAEEAAVLWGLAQASVEELTYELGVNRRAADALITHGPYESIVDVAGVEHVGHATLLSLLSHAPVWSEKMDSQVSL